MLKDKRIKIGAIIILAVLLMVVWFSCGRNRVEVVVVKVERGNILNSVSASGMVDADSADMGSGRVAGRVSWVGVAEGNRVRAGQLLLTFDGYAEAQKEYYRRKGLHAQGFTSDRDFELAKNERDAACIVSPIAGTVTKISVIVGETVSPGVSIVSVVATQRPWAEIQIDEVDIAKIKIGQRVRFTTDAYPDQSYYGKIYWVNNAAELKKVGGRVRGDEEDLVFRAKVALEEEYKELKPLMSVYAEVIIGEKKDVLVLPREAITLRDGKGAVFAIKGGRARLVDVTIGLRDAEKVEILSGLKEGDKIAASNLDKLKDGTRVKQAKDKGK
ncbi:MAG: efflux RND transporter periplasmic adaptor subunit [Candidatus Margulisiibacteriota bacterium]